MRLSIISIFALLCIFPVEAIEFEGATKPVLSTGSHGSSGLNEVYVASTTSGLTMVYTAASASSAVKWYRFSNMGAAYAEELTPTRSGARLSLPAEPDMGYVIEEGGVRTCYWLIDYSRHELDLRSLTVAPEQECDAAVLNFDGEADGLPFYTATGRRMTLSRELEIRYQDASFDTSTFSFVAAEGSETLASMGHTFSVHGVYVSTAFELCGDAFLRRWGEPEQCVSTSTYTPYGLEAYTRATQTEREIDNEQSEEAVDGLGGSAPCEVTFEAAVSEAAVFTEWQISRSPDFSIIENSFSELTLTYTFTDQGTTYVRFVANNADGTCEYVGDTYEVFIGESKLLIPNAFSPEASPGINDEWKVSYKSIVSYECHIFNRWGTLLFSSTNPAEGWDGKYRGKYVPAGVYFYVIKARGADGVDYDKAGDINIIKYRQGSTGSATPAE
ncbi:MAG: gliding motility-associated C-terminal domain-containing protein [Muribaculaceae bacterium]|nr:gliding motility-associated C-terminal domain-containing protein [Muribaculaceae bacterium]